jgi:carboxyl-terminal processing protease
MQLKVNKTLTTGVVLGTIIGVATSVSLNVFAFKSASPTIPLEQIKKFSEVYSRVKRSYVEEVDDKKLISGAISGMLSSLDPHSAYLDEDAFTELRVGTSGEFGGLGIEVGMENGFVKVISPIDDTPAYKAGLKSGDLIIRLDDKPVKGLTLSDAVKLMRGKPGEPIELMVVREGKDKPFKVKIIRAIIKIKSVKQRMLEPGFGYVRISSFQSKTTQGVIDGLAKLKKENKGQLKGLILDLRNNPGGVLNGAVGVSDVFLDNSGKIVYTEGRVADALMRYDANPGDKLEGAPMVVLVNQGSASASEIVSGALQDFNRSIIVGEKTFGKGSVQVVMPIGEDEALKLTVARYYLPSGRTIQAVGVTPDIKVHLGKIEVKEDPIMLKERDLKKHLESELAKIDVNTTKSVDANESSENNETKVDDTIITEAQMYKDAQLKSAVDILKALIITNKGKH